MPKYVLSDGRVFTSYVPNCDLTDGLGKKYGFTPNNSHALRQFLQQNADKIIKDNAAAQYGEQSADCVFCPVCKQAVEYKPPAAQ